MIAPNRQTRLFTFLDGSGHEVNEVGGKATGLDTLLSHGYPVPDAVVLTTAAYRLVTTEHSLRLLVDDLATTPLPTPDHTAAESAATERLFLAVDLPEKVTATIRRIGDEFLGNLPLVVRSSATAEDSASASFAGQYLTVTDVTTASELEVAVRRCWASLWLPAPRSYRRRHGISETHIAMAVIIQKQINPEWSGVAFTTDPGGRDHLLRIEAVRGMGEALVSGKVTPADYLIRRDNLEILSPIDNQQPRFVEDLARLVLRVERSLGNPQDIEWAYNDTGIHLLQARPITEASRPIGTEDGFDTTGDDAATYTPHGIIEMLPGVVPPLLWTINAPMLENAFRATFADLGGTCPPDNRPLVTRFRGRAALDLSAICDTAASLPGGDPAEVERQYLGRVISDEPDPTSGGAHLFAALRGREAHKRIVDEVRLVAAAAQAIAGLDVGLAPLPVRRLVAYRQRIRDLAWRGYAAEVGASSAAGATYRALELLLERWLPQDEAALWAQRVTRGAIDSSSLGGIRAGSLERVLRTYGTRAIQLLIRDQRDDVRDQIENLPDEGPRFLGALDEAIRAMGSKSVYGDASWIEDEVWIWRQLQTLDQEGWERASSRPDGDMAFSELQHRLTLDKKWKRTRVITGQLVDVRIRWLRRQVDETTRFLELRERAKNALLVLGGEERRIIIEASTRLVASRQLPDAALVGYLTDAELESMLFGACGVDRSELERRLAAGTAAAVARPLPDWFNGSPDHVTLDEYPTGDRLTGWATSPGRVDGPVRVISSLADGVRLGKGEILVAHATDPSWTPLFLTAGAVVLETGGPLSHAAIVAREFGLPAVLNVPHATRILSDGEPVLVDGTLGIVDRHRSAGSPR